MENLKEKYPDFFETFNETDLHEIVINEEDWDIKLIEFAYENPEYKNKIINILIDESQESEYNEDFQDLQDDYDVYFYGYNVDEITDMFISGQLEYVIDDLEFDKNTGRE